MRARIAEWVTVSRWRKRVERVLAPSGLTFTQWLVLGASRELLRTTEDAVTQSDVSAHLGMHRSTVSDAVLVLTSKGLVDRGGAADGPVWRVVLTPNAGRLLADLDPQLEAASRPE